MLVQSGDGELLRSVAETALQMMGAAETVLRTWSILDARGLVERLTVTTI
jgi:hypothetical protein